MILQTKLNFLRDSFEADIVKDGKDIIPNYQAFQKNHHPIPPPRAASVMRIYAYRRKELCVPQI